jgi:hypothetical protein
LATGPDQGHADGDGHAAEFEVGGLDAGRERVVAAGTFEGGSAALGPEEGIADQVGESGEGDEFGVVAAAVLVEEGIQGVGLEDEGEDALGGLGERNAGQDVATEGFQDVSSRSSWGSPSTPNCFPIFVNQF